MCTPNDLRVRHAPAVQLLGCARESRTQVERTHACTHTRQTEDRQKYVHTEVSLAFTLPCSGYNVPKSQGSTSLETPVGPQ